MCAHRPMARERHVTSHLPFLAQLPTGHEVVLHFSFSSDALLPLDVTFSFVYTTPSSAPDPFPESRI